jgi:hypothetical protein
MERLAALRQSMDDVARLREPLATVGQLAPLLRPSVLLTGAIAFLPGIVGAVFLGVRLGMRSARRARSTPAAAVQFVEQNSQSRNSQFPNITLWELRVGT